MTPQILIVGAGPSGLVLALNLARQGVAFRIVDKGEGPGATSRALAVHARTLEFYRQLGIADRIVEAGILLDHFDLRVKGRKVAMAPLGAMGQGISPYPFILGLPQDVHEQILIETLASLGITVERRTALTGFTQLATGVRATLHGPAGEETLEVEYVAGCDGASSAVRHQLGIGFPGGTYDQVFFVADVDAEGDLPDNALTVSLNSEGFCLVLPVRQTGAQRVIGMVPQAREKQESFTFEDVALEAARDTGLTIGKLHWFSTYHVHHRVAESFRVGRVFLAGDAGHIHSPAGGQGMNTGIGDAMNLAWKLSAVVKGQAKSEILDTYVQERMAFAQVLIATTDRAFRFVATRAWWGSLWRTLVVPYLAAVLTRLKPVLRFAFRTVSQTAIEYRDSKLSSGGAGQVKAGDRLPWVESAANDAPLTARDWQIHVYGEAGEPLGAAAGDLPIHAFAWSDALGAAGFARDAIYLVRPDGYIGFATLGQSESACRALQDYLKRWGIRGVSQEDPSSRT
ncbi:FAD-dependent monooxygenase [Lacibacterium aquatile]|uniref:FAD-dependent monooxygenase n=1 Tax=Lacibacterium aquatile TaxID=1168082 RepID=A0ABW5DL75_9PROT